MHVTNSSKILILRELFMVQMLDMDNLRTFLAIAETGSFTAASREVFKTQSAVSMQMRRLEETIGKKLFYKNGRVNSLTRDGDILLNFARRIIRLNNEAFLTITQPEVSGLVRLGIGDDYAERYLPEILARFSYSSPNVEVDIVCDDSAYVAKQLLKGKLDLAIGTGSEFREQGELLKRERLVWATSANHNAHLQDVLPLAICGDECCWSAQAIKSLKQVGRTYRIAYQARNHAVIASTVIAGLAVTAIAESGLRPGMRTLSADEGFGELGTSDILLLKPRAELSSAAEILSQHICDSLASLGTNGIAQLSLVAE